MIHENIHELFVLFKVDMKSVVYCLQNTPLASVDGPHVETESSRIMQVILETEAILIDKQRLFKVFVCEEETGTIESIVLLIL